MMKSKRENNTGKKNIVKNRKKGNTIIRFETPVSPA
jgi:hypothetical protein